MNSIDRNTFNIGDTGLTRDGRRFTIVDKDTSDIPYYARVDGEEDGNWYWRDGRSDRSMEQGRDLMPPEAEPAVSAPMFVVGSTGKTRDGRAYRVIAVDRKGETYPVVALVTSSRRQLETVEVYTPNGVFFDGGGTEGADLMPPSRTFYVNLYDDGRAYHYATEDRARGESSATLRTLIATAVPVELPA